MKLYIVHGWTYTIEPWSKTVDLLRSRGVEVVQLRVPGLTAESSAPWTINGYVEWLHGELKNDPAPIVLGHSNGGRIALNLLSAQPERFKHLILLNSAGVYEKPAAVGLKRRIFRTLSIIFRPLKKIPGVRRVVYRLIGGSDYVKAPEHMKQTLDNMLRSDAELDISKVTTPTTILWGREDKTTPVGMGRKMAKLLPNSTLKEFDDWKHAPYITHPDQLTDVLHEVLESVA